MKNNIVIIVFLMLTLLNNVCFAQESHFKPTEFACRHCGKQLINHSLITKLELLRKKLGNTPIIVTSGYRCPTHNKEVGGVKKSQHVLGNAVDIKVKGYKPRQVSEMAKKCGFVWTKAYPTFTHIDVRNL